MFRYDGGSATNRLAFYYSTNGVNTVSVLRSAWTPTADTWYHIAVDCDGSGQIRIYLDGAVVASAARSAALVNNGTSLYVGQEQSGGGSSRFRGHLDEMRITKGVARYGSGSGFTPPTAAFPRS